MANTIQKFTHSQFGEIRVYNRQGEPWFIGKEIAQKMGYSNGTKAVMTHVANDDKLYSQIGNAGQLREMILINESGLYALILASKLPQAKAFKRWVTSEVLPQIRKTGGYIPVAQEEDDTTILARALQITQKTLMLKDQQLAAQGEIIAELAPDAAYAQQVLSAPGCYTMTEVAKGLSLTEEELKNKLMKKGIIFRAQSGMFMLYAPFQKRGYEAYRTNRTTPETQEPRSHSYLVWTELGRQFIHSIM